MPSFYSFGNKWSVKNNKTTVRNSLTSDVNTVNIDQAVWDGSNNVTSVGTNGRPSYYGCYDMNGNVWEWNDLNQTSSRDRGIRGGFWGCCNRGPYALGSDDSNITYRAQDRYDTFGLRIASLTNPNNLPNFVLVGDAGNSSETIPNRWRGPVTIGGVSYEYYINKYKVTNDEYALFLNSVASTDTYGLFGGMFGGSIVSRGIVRTGSSGSYVYSVKANYGNKPFTNINWFTCARYCNWLHNGKPTGAQNNSSTEDGAYFLNGFIGGNAIPKKAGAKYFLPTENEWYKAAYYKGGGTNRGYWRYATQSNDYPRAILADVNGNGTLRPTSFKPSNTVGSGITTETITDNIFNVGLSLNYEQVASSGVTRIVPITSSIPNLPPNFTLSNNIGKYNITTTSSVSGNIDIKFILPVGISLSTFNNTKIFHTTSSGTFDVTVTSGPNAPNYSTRTKYGRVTGFSDFYLIPSTETALNQVVPSSLVGSVGNGYVDLSWSMSNAIDIIDYNIKYSKDNGVSWIDYEHVPQIELSIRVSGLTNGSSYLFKVASVSAEGLSELSASSSSLTPLSIVPSAPSNVVAVSALNSAHLTWDVPSDNGGSIITGYIVQYSSDNGSSWTSSNDPLYLFADDVSTTRSLTVTNLSAIPYVFRVAAVNSVGSGSYSSVSNSATPSGAAEVTPTPTPSSSGVAITSTPTATPTSTLTPTTTPTTTITNTPSSSIIAVTPTPTVTLTPTTSLSQNQTLSSPTNITASLSGKDAIISFTPPTSTGGSPITNYIIQYSKNNGTSWTDFTRAVSTATSNIVVNNLLYYRSYIFRVVAVNGVENSSPSSNSNSIVTPPGIVGNLYGKFKRGGRPTDSEMLSGNVLSTPLSSPSLYSSIDYGENDDEYGFIAIGYFVPPTDGTYTFYTSSDDGSAVWLGDIASASSGRSSSNAVVNNNIIGYQGDTRRSGTISLTANQVYAIRIIHREGDGGDNLTFGWSGPGISERTSLATYFYANNLGSEPPEVSTVRVEALDSKIDLYITTVSAPATYYTIYYSSDNGNNYSLFGNGQTSPASPIIVNGLTNETSYKLKIIAVNSTGPSDEYIVSNVIPSSSNIRPLSLGQSFLSNIHTDLVADSEFENIRIGQTFLSNIYTDTVAENEFDNIRIAQTFLSNIYSDPI